MGCGFVAAYCAMDLMIIVDSSGSVRDNQVLGVDNWNLTKIFVKEVISRGLNVGQHYDRVALIIFSNTAELRFAFNRYYSLDDILAAVDRLPFIGSVTNTSLALDLGREVFLDPMYGSRPNATHIMLLVTDLVEVPSLAWRNRFVDSVSLLNSTTDVQRFSGFLCFLKLNVV